MACCGEPTARAAGSGFMDQQDEHRLRFIRACRGFGFSIDEVRALLSLTDDRSTPCTEARDLARRHLAVVQAKLRELRALEKSIAALVSGCNATCAGGPATDCCIFEDLRHAEPNSRIA